MRSSVSVVCAVVVLGLITLSSNGEATYEPGWGDPQIIDSQDWQSVGSMDVAMDAAGNAVAVWIQHDNVFFLSVYSNRYVAGVGWGVAQLIEDCDIGSADYPRVAMDDDGNAFAVWRQHDSVQYSIWANRYVAGVGWGACVAIESDDLHSVAAPEIVVDGDGNAIVAWGHHDGARYNVYSNRYTVGVGWGTPGAIEDFDGGDASGPKLAVDSEGNVMAVWQQYATATSTWSLASNRYVVGSGWSLTGQEVESMDDWAIQPDVAVDGDGNAFAVWAHQQDLQFSIFANRYVVGSGWATPHLLETSDAGGAYDPQVAADDAGNAVVVWNQDAGTVRSIWSNRYVSGAGWSTASLIETDDAGSAFRPRLAMTAYGDAVAVWYQDDGIRTNIVSNRYVPGEGWGVAELVETNNGGRAVVPEVAVDGAGNAVAVWYQSDGAMVWNGWANRYVVPDTTPPVLTLTSPADGVTVDEPSVNVSGTTEPGAFLVVNGYLVMVEPDGSFSFKLALSEGWNSVVATATDEAGNSVVVARTITYVGPIAILLEELDVLGSELANVTGALEDALDKMAGLRDDLADSSEELDAMDSDLSGVRAQNLLLMAVLLVVAILAGLMAFLYLGLRKKIQAMEGDGQKGSDKA